MRIKFSPIRVIIASLVAYLVLTGGITPAEAKPEAKVAVEEVVRPAGGPLITEHPFIAIGSRNYNHPAENVPNTACYNFIVVDSLKYGSTIFAKEGISIIGVCWRNYVIITGTTWVCHAYGPPPHSSYIYGPEDFNNICTTLWGFAGGPTRTMSFDMDFRPLPPPPSDWHEVDIDLADGTFQFMGGTGGVFSGKIVYRDYI